MDPLKLDTAVYRLESEEDSAVQVLRDDLLLSAGFLETARAEPDEALRRLVLEAGLRAPSIEKRARQLADLYASARRRGITEGEALQRMEKRRSVPLLRDYVVVAICKKGTFALTHDESVRGADLEKAFRMDEALDRTLDRLDRALFRLDVTEQLGTRLLTDEEWEDGLGGTDPPEGT